MANDEKKNAFNKGLANVGEGIKQAAEKGKQFAQNMANDTKIGMHNLSVKMQDENIKAQLKKYNPVFPEDYQSEGFGLPNMIVIVDDAVRKDIEVCKGAIGWKSMQKDMEVFHLYDEAIEFSGLEFVPTANCDSVYYVDCFDRKKYIKLDSYFEYEKTGKLAELEHIAFCLGAKSYSIIREESEGTEHSANFIVNKIATPKNEVGGNVNNSGESDVSVSSTDTIEISKKKRVTERTSQDAKFESSREPIQPALKWYKTNDKIKNLVDMVLAKQKLTNYEYELKNSEVSGISITAAKKVDIAIKALNIGAKFDICGKVKKESEITLIFKIEF